MNRINTFFSETYNELMHKVSWPTWEELQGSLIVVTGATIIIALLVWVMDVAASTSMSLYYDLFK